MVIVAYQLLIAFDMLIGNTIVRTLINPILEELVAVWRTDGSPALE